MSRRFAYVLEFDRNGGYLAGTKEQQATIRGRLKELMTRDSPLDLVMRAVAVKVKWYWNDLPPGDRLPVITTFVKGLNGLASDDHIWIHPSWTGDGLEAIWFHELGHVVGINLFNPQNASEGWAEEFKLWCANGCPTDSPVWRALESRIEEILDL